MGCATANVGRHSEARCSGRVKVTASESMEPAACPFRHREPFAALPPRGESVGRPPRNGSKIVFHCISYGLQFVSERRKKEVCRPTERIKLHRAMQRLVD